VVARFPVHRFLFFHKFSNQDISPDIRTPGSISPRRCGSTSGAQYFSVDTPEIQA